MQRLVKFIKKYEFPIHMFVLAKKAKKWWGSARGTISTKIYLISTGCTYGKNLVVDGVIKMHVRKKGAIRIGDSVKINSRFDSNLIGLNCPVILQCLGDGCIVIGNESGLSGVVISSLSKVEIGQRVKMGGNVRIYDHDFHSLNHLVRRTGEALCEIPTRSISIGDDVFIGTNSIILKGVAISERAIVGANSVVTRSVPSGEVWAGNPAVFIKKIKLDDYTN